MRIWRDLRYTLKGSRYVFHLIVLWLIFQLPKTRVGVIITSTLNFFHNNL